MSNETNEERIARIRRKDFMTDEELAQYPHDGKVRINSNLFFYRGRNLTLTQLFKIAGGNIPLQTIRSRLLLGWTASDAMTKAVDKRKRTVVAAVNSAKKVQIKSSKSEDLDDDNDNKQGRVKAVKILSERLDSGGNSILSRTIVRGGKY